MMELHDKQSEESLIGAAMINSAVIPACREIVSAGDFAVPEYAAIWAVIERLADDPDSDVNLVTVAAACRVAGSTTTPADISRLTDAVAGSTRHAAHTATVVHGLADKRRIADILARATAGLASKSTSHGAARAIVESLESIAVDATRDPWLGMVEATSVTTALLANPQRGVSTGIQRLDDLRVAFRPGDYVILGGQTSHGKSAMALNMLLAAAAAGTPCYLFSLEMPASSIMERIWACLGRVPLSLIRDGGAGLDGGQQIALKRAQTTAQSLPIRINDTAGIGVDDVRACAADAPDGSLIVIDYIGLMTPATGAGAYGSKVHEVSATSLALQRIARDHNVTLLALSQLSRKSDARTDKAPMLSDLRDSGSLEQDAGLVLLVSLPSRYDATEPATRGVLTVAKHRQGECGTVEMHWEGQYTLFSQQTLSTFPVDTPPAVVARRQDRSKPKQYNYAGAQTQ